MVRWMLGLACAAAAPALAQCAPEWTALGAGVSQEVHSIAIGVIAHGPRRPLGLYVAGFFWAVGPHPWSRVAMWDAEDWREVGGGAPWDLATPLVGLIRERGDPWNWYVAGDINWGKGESPGNIMRRGPGGTWVPLSKGVWHPTLSDFVYALCEYDDGNTSTGEESLYVGGTFSIADGVPCNGFARWGGTSWSAPPDQPGRTNPNTRPTVYALAVYDDDGAGPRRPGLYVAGSFDKVGQLPARNIARWDGTSWEALGNGVNSTVFSLCAFDDDGPGPRPQALFVSGSFNNAGGAFASKFARWDGASWSAPQGTSLGSNARAMLVWDDDGPGPNGPALYAAGFFSPGVAKWRGVGHAWEPLGGPLSGGIGGVSVGYALCAWDEDGPGPNPGGLYVGGQFKFVNGVPANYIARWGCPLPPGGPCYPDCNQDGTLNLADFGCFSTKFATADPYADCNSDGVRDLADFGCFQTRFALGCP